jgi:hypothetical protein
MTARGLLRRLGLAGPLVFAAAVLTVAGPSDAHAQATTGSASMSVGATVVRSCSVETSAGEPVRIRCGRTTIIYPLQPGSAPMPRDGRVAGPSVSSAPNTGTVTIQF